MNMNATIQRLGPGDEERLRELNALFAKAFEDPASYSSAPPGREHLQRILALDHMIVLVASIGGAIAGGLVAYELEKFEQERREIYIYDLAVDEAHRRKGIATALIEELKAIAAGRAVWVIYVQADLDDPPAIALYEKLGVREDVLHFDIAVDPHKG
ncbi:MAG TPA: AAC(3)-I family aminoglycoside N-acetyltransferase [Rhizobiaceae bacterium]|nr:AAC(3)-I family aminoglycoside N-acetyltransferase [Rhizobiaceae bacterium]